MRIYFFLFLFLLGAPARAESLSPENLAQEMGTRITRVPEFEFIREEAQKLGVRVYLFGGTAAAYGHYVRQDLEREAGDKRYPDFLYDYDYTNIFRSTQDLDVVVDGSGAQAMALEAALKNKFPHFLGEKSADWEVRPLREQRGDKEPILGNPNFQNQHTDSHSTGMVEVTRTPVDESAVKDVRDWANKKPQFLTDVAEQKLHYYFNPLHETTTRAKAGLNPPILSVIRYLTKAFQYDLKISGEDEERVRAIIRDFNPSSLSDPYVKKWVEKNGKKLFQHAVDLEYAWDTLEKFGLREKLMSLGKVSDIDSLAWWMNKQPLRSKAVGEGARRTAAEIFGKDLTFAHETNSFLAYESLTRSRAGELNAFISRKNAIGEAALYGEGFYLAHGRRGARGTGITLRATLDPTAREGTDFLWDNVLVLQNKAAVKILPENIQLTLPGYFRFLIGGGNFSPDDRALMDIFKRKLVRKLTLEPKAAEAAEINQLMREELTKEHPNLMALMEWRNIPGLAAREPKLATEIKQKSYTTVVSAIARGSYDDLDLLQTWFSSPLSAEYPELLEEVAKIRDQQRLVGLLAPLIARQPHWQARPDWFVPFLKHDAALAPLAFAFGNSSWKDPRPVDEFVRQKKQLSLIASNVLGNPNFAENKFQWALDIVRHGQDEAAIGSIAVRLNDTRANWQDHPEVLEALFKHTKKFDDTLYIFGNFENKYWLPVLKKAVGDQPVTAANLRSAFEGGFSFGDYHIVRDRTRARRERLESLLAQKTLTEADEKSAAVLVKEMLGDDLDKAMLLEWFSHPLSAKFPEIVQSYPGKFDLEVAAEIFRQPAMIKNDAIFASLAEKVPPEMFNEAHNGVFGPVQAALSDPATLSRRSVLEAWARSGAEQYTQALMDILAGPEGRRHAYLLPLLSDRKSPPHFALLEKVLSRPEWADQTEILEEMIHRWKNPVEDLVPEHMRAYLNAASFYQSLVKKVFATPHWQDSAPIELLVKMGVSDAEIIGDLLDDPKWASYRERWAKEILARGELNSEAAFLRLLRASHDPFWPEHPDLLAPLFRNLQLWPDKRAHLEKLLARPGWQDSLQKLFGEEVFATAQTQGLAAWQEAFAKNSHVPVPASCPGAFAEVGR